MRKAPEHKRSPTIAPPMYIVPASGADLVCEPVICNEAPDDEAIAACKALGTALAQ